MGGGRGWFVIYRSLTSIMIRQLMIPTYVNGVEWEGLEVGYHLRNSITLIKDHVYI